MTAPLFPVMTGSLPPAPYARKPSIVDRVAARLFPMAQYSGLLSPEDQAGIQHQGLLSLGANLLRASGPTTVPTSFGQAVGNALGGVDMNQMVDRALQLKAYKSEQDQQQAIAAAAARHPTQSGETQQQTLDRMIGIMTDMLAVPGGEAVAAKMAPIITALKQERGAVRDPLRIEGTNTKLGTPFIGREGTILLDPVTHEQIGFFPKATPAKEPTPIERQSGQQAQGMRASILRLEDIERQHPGAADEVAGVLAAGKWPLIGRFAEGLRSLGLSDAGNEYLTEANNYLTEAVRASSGRGGQPTAQALAAEAATSIPTLNEGPESRAAKQAHRWQRFAEANARAGRAAVPTPAPKSGTSPANPFAPGGQYYVESPQ